VETWGISGGAFLAIYGAVLTLTGLMVFAACRRIRGESHGSAVPGASAAELSPYEVAMLKGGESLVLTVVACRLKEAGSLAPSEDGAGLVIAGPLPAQPDEIEMWAYARVQRLPGNAGAVLDEKDAAHVLGRLRDRLCGLGLMLEHGQRSSLRRRVWWFAPAAALGVARLIAGLHNHRPVGWLVLLLAAGAYGAYVLTTPPLTTLAGRRALGRVRKDSSLLGAYGFAGDVALSGVGALWAADATLAAALGLKRPGGWAGGGGGCGGGGCGGGGCGG
jgi:uncharacterized protein (TIGR04222 family)